MTSTKTALTGLLAIGLSLGSAAAFAEPSPAREALKQHCTGDYMDYCSAYAPGGPEVEACFKANLKNLTPGCSAAITAYKKEQKSTKRYSEAH
ncbi:cysteine rich repeat-containing protein [Methylobacterium sp. J-026]|uniref:cysteine rich repeat-containing protein n=1 Tax=Methylobacterium sp. J-026 TaxID=2836624 RepID=UPI001FBB47DC|nr:cysteine rich repeat-containing protein [Methylobacterium sp. J-026]MCJ2135636.1 cysteine rich repeat-containing protein [Methylobacterium sp. J-026]